MGQIARVTDFSTPSAGALRSVSLAVFPYMETPPNISEPIIETLYAQALVLADEARQVFDLTPVQAGCGEADRVRLALSVEGLRTTTRIMHVLAWLLNHRAFFAGDMSELQLRRYSKLPDDRLCEPENLALLEEGTCLLIAESQQLHARIMRLDIAWRKGFEINPPAVRRLRERLNRSFATA